MQRPYSSCAPGWLRWPLALLLALGGLLFLQAIPQILARHGIEADERWLLILSGFWLGYLPLKTALRLTLLPKGLPFWPLLEALALDSLVVGGGLWVAFSLWHAHFTLALLLLLGAPVYLLLRLPVLIGKLRPA